MLTVGLLTIGLLTVRLLLPIGLLPELAVGLLLAIRLLAIRLLAGGLLAIRLLAGPGLSTLRAEPGGLVRIVGTAHDWLLLSAEHDPRLAAVVDSGRVPRTLTPSAVSEKNES